MDARSCASTTPGKVRWMTLGRTVGRGLIVAAAAALLGRAAALAGGRPADRRAPAESRHGAEEVRLETVRAEIEELKQRLAGTEARAGSVLDAIDEIDLRIALLGREGVALRRETAAAGAQEEATRRQAEALASRLQDSERALRIWLREIYKAGPVEYLRLVAASSSPAQVAEAHRAAEAMSLSAGGRVEAYRTDCLRLEQALADLEEQRRSRRQLEADLRQKDAELRDSRRSKEAMLAGLKRQRTSQETALRELVQVQKQIQGLIARLEGQGREQPMPSTGFARQRGLLRWPAQGPLAVPFGNVRNPRFNTVVPHPGIDIAAPLGQEVRSVFAGRVVFSDWFRGYGQMLVIDHGEGYLTIYGHVEERLVAAGADVEQGDLIARSGDGGSFEIPGLYFEIRHDGKPEDPSAWLRAPTSRAADHRAAPRTAP